MSTQSNPPADVVAAAVSSFAIVAKNTVATPACVVALSDEELEAAKDAAGRLFRLATAETERRQSQRRATRRADGADE